MVDLTPPSDPERVPDIVAFVKEFLGNYLAANDFANRSYATPGAAFWLRRLLHHNRIPQLQKSLNQGTWPSARSPGFSNIILLLDAHRWWFR